jgi:hypothetical protein
LAPDEKATQIMIGTPDALIWGDLVTKERVRMSAFLNTLAEEFVTVHDAKVLFLCCAEKNAPETRQAIHVKQEEIMIFYAMHDREPLPDETETRRYEPVEFIAGTYQVEGRIFKSPFSTLQNTLLLSKATYIPVYEASLRHIGKPWLGSFSNSLIQVRQHRVLATGGK